MPRGATPSRWCVCQFHHFGEDLRLRTLFLFWRRSRRSALLLLPLRWLLSLCRLLPLCRLTLRRLLLLLARLFRPFANHGGSTGLGDQYCKSERRNHEDYRGSGSCLTQDRTGAACTERGLCATASESAGPIRAFALLQQHDKN